MKLDVMERLVALNFLPKEGTFTNLKLIRVAREELSFNEEEHKALQFKQTGDQLNWNQGVKIFKEVDIGEVVSIMLADALKSLNAGGKLKEEHFSLYEKMISE
jgi:hypothetical protein